MAPLLFCSTTSHGTLSDQILSTSTYRKIIIFLSDNFRLMRLIFAKQFSENANRPLLLGQRDLAKQGG